MPRYICKLDGMYFEWSTVVDAPVTHGMTLEEFRGYYRTEYGRHASGAELDDRLLRVDALGTSSRLHRDIADLIAWNRAGDDESVATRAEIVAMLRSPAPSAPARDIVKAIREQTERLSPPKPFDPLGGFDPAPSAKETR